MNRDRWRDIGIGAGAVVVTAVVGLVGYSVAERLGLIPHASGKDDSSGTKFPTLEPSQTPFPAKPTEKSTSTPLPTFEPSSTPTATPLSPEGIIVQKLVKNAPISDYPALVNALGDETGGGATSQVNVNRFIDYFSNRILGVKLGDTVLQRIDRMFGQLSLPVKDLADRGLNFDWNNGGQGLGFEMKDLETLRTLEDQEQVQNIKGNGVVSPISRLDEDGNRRSMTLTTARDFEKAVLMFVDEHLRLKGIPNPALDASVQAERRSLFEEIIYGEYGVKEIGQGDGLWQTVSNYFKACETFTKGAETRVEQPEALRPVVFNPDQETGSSTTEEDTASVRDSDNPVLVVMVDGSNGELRVETYDLSDPPDTLNSGLGLNKYLLEEAGLTRAHGGRWIPCRPGEQRSSSKSEEQPKPDKEEKPPANQANQAKGSNPGNGTTNRGSDPTGNPGTVNNPDPIKTEH